MTMTFHSRPPSLTWPLFRPLFVEALPWLLLATTARWVATVGGPPSFPAVLIAAFAVLHAFFVMVYRSTEPAGTPASPGELGILNRYKVSLSIFWRIVLLQIAMMVILSTTGYRPLSLDMAFGIDGLAYDQDSMVGKFWSATVAVLVALMIAAARHNAGRVKLFAAVRELSRQWRWVGAAVIVLGLVYLGLSLVQGMVRGMVWDFRHDSSSSDVIKRLVSFVYTLGFAMLRLSVTTLILTYGLKWSSRRTVQPTGVSSASP
jgi:hypothetical protein